MQLCVETRYTVIVKKQLLTRKYEDADLCCMCDGAAGYLRRSDCDEMCKEGDEGVRL